MKYHDNEVFIQVQNDFGYSLKKGSYLVESFSVTPGQDPDGKIYNGLKLNFESDGKMSFRVGRKGSETVANWFTNNIPASHTTFNHDPEKLNFAFIGSLNLTVSGGIFGKNEIEFTFPNIALAQGSDFLSNNWWFGGKDCNNVGSNTVSCIGKNQNGLTIPFYFLRGGNSVDKVQVSSKSNVNDWMSNLSDTISLDQIMMPGSHDAGMSELSHCNPALFSGPYTQTQSLTVGNQLSNGSRYFDIRVDYDYSNLVTYHRSDAHGCNGQSLKDVFDEAVSFLRNNNQEIAIFKISHIRDYGSNHKPSETKEKINNFLNEYTPFIYTNKNKDANLAKVALGELRGKLILVFDYPEYINAETGRFRYMDGNVAKQDANITVFDEYSDSSKYDEMEIDQLKKWKANGGLGKGYFFLLSWTLTSNDPPFSGSIESLAKEANSHLPSVLYKQIVISSWTKPNIVYIDYLNESVTKDIISYNLDGSLPLKSRK